MADKKEKVKNRYANPRPGGGCAIRRIRYLVDFWRRVRLTVGGWLTESINPPINYGREHRIPNRGPGKR
jgi:hypothetical protein